MDLSKMVINFLDTKNGQFRTKGTHSILYTRLEFYVEIKCMKNEVRAFTRRVKQTDETSTLQKVKQHKSKNEQCSMD